ncbi:MAG: hypothetical protein FJ264_03300 [Planctomycetes bacterium]|nr:hypothetical protein [Planctomycetota bacterium]
MNIYKYASALLPAVVFGCLLFLPLNNKDRCFAGEKYAGDKYEYKVVRTTSVGIPEDTLNAEGEDGWELVILHQDNRFKYFIFKRKIIDNTAVNKITPAPSKQ